MLWFLNQWAVAYLLENDPVSEQINMPFLCTFGRDSEAGMWGVNYLLELAANFLVSLNSEPGVSRDAVNLFISLVGDNKK